MYVTTVKSQLFGSKQKFTPGVGRDKDSLFNTPFAPSLCVQVGSLRLIVDKAPVFCISRYVLED